MRDKARPFVLRLPTGKVAALDAIRERYGNAPRAVLIRWAIDRFLEDVSDAENDESAPSSA